MRVVLIGLHEGATIKTHKTNRSISVQLMEGEILFITEEETINLKKGHVIFLLEDIPHSVIARKESFVLLTLSTGTK